MMFLDDITLEECRLRAIAETSKTEAMDMDIPYMDYLSIKYEIELCYAEKRILNANPLLRYLR